MHKRWGSMLLAGSMGVLLSATAVAAHHEDKQGKKAERAQFQEEHQLLKEEQHELHQQHREMKGDQSELHEQHRQLMEEQKAHHQEYRKEKPDSDDDELIKAFEDDGKRDKSKSKGKGKKSDD